MPYLRKLSSLKDMATFQLAINLCQDNSFKEVTMCLEKPISKYFSQRYTYISEKVKEWDAAIDEQCQRLMDGLPHSLKQGVHVWMTRIALEYASYTQRMELLFRIPRYYCMDILIVQDWTETGRVNEKRLAKRLLKDERLTIFQQYRIACVYCLHKSIPDLWNRLTSEEKQLIIGKDDPSCSQEKNPFVLLWSYHMDGRREEKVYRQKKHLWICATLHAVRCGNQAALMQCWKRLNKDARKRIATYGALQSLEKWTHIRNKDKWKEKLIFNKYSRPLRRPAPVARFNLPFYYSELVRFFLSKMSNKQQLRFFEIAWENWRNDFDSSQESYNILNCLLEWPLQDHFLATINRLWGITPKGIYGRCLLTLAVKCSGDYDSRSWDYDSRSSSASFYIKENLFYDYRSVLWNLWEETPEEYKQYAFSHVLYWDYCYKSVIEHVLPQLLTRSPLQEKDVSLFKQIWHDVPQKERKAAMYEKDGKNICSILVEKEMLFFINWLLEECLPNVEIPSFKLDFTELVIIHKACFIKLQENCEKYVEDLIDWAFESDTDKLRFRYEIIKYHGITHCCQLLDTGEYAELERIINFCLSSEEMKLQLKIDVVKKTRRGFLKDCAWEEMDKSIAWIFDEEEKIKEFKKDFFYSDDFVFDIHLELVFYQSPQWENVECFYKWFCLSSQEIIELKKKTVLSSRVIDVVYKALCELKEDILYVELDAVVISLRWCLTDEKMVISFREELEKYFFVRKGTKYNNKGKKRSGYLVSELLQSIQKEVVHGKTSTESPFIKDNGGKKSLTMEEDKFNSIKKRLRKKFFERNFNKF